MFRTTTTLAVLLASVALPSVAAARTVPMKVGKAAIVRQAYGVGKRVARQTAEPFVKAQVSNCYRRNGGLYCSVQLDYTTLYCTGINGATVYSSGRLVTKLWTTAASGDAGCKRYAPRPKPKPTPTPAPAPPSNQVSLSAGEAAIRSFADGVGQNMVDDYGDDYLGPTLSGCGRYGGGTGVFCEITSDFLDVTGDAFSCSSQARATNDGSGDTNVDFTDTVCR